MPLSSSLLETTADGPAKRRWNGGGGGLKEAVPGSGLAPNQQSPTSSPAWDGATWLR